MKRKLAFLLVLVVCAALMLGACGGNTEQPAAPAEQPAAVDPTPAAELEKSVTIKLAGIKTEDDPATQAMRRFAEIVNADETANITVEVFPNSELGSINDMLSGMPSGLTDMFYNTLSCYSWLTAAQMFNAVTAPFIWDSHEQLQAFLDSEAAQAWLEEAAIGSGVRVLAAEGELPPRQLTSNKAVYTAADFEGLKVRTAESALVQETMKKLGATPVVVPFADLYLALRQGTVDAQENNFITAKNSSFYEVQEYFMKTDYIRDVCAIFISENLWQALSPVQQTLVKNAAVEAVNYEAELIAASMEETMEFLNENMTYIDVDVKSIQDKLGADIYQEFDAAGEVWPTGTIEVVLDFKANYNN